MLFTGHIFVYIDLATDDYRKVQSTYGVSQIFKACGQIGKLPKNFIEALKSAKVVAPQTYAGNLKLGDNIEIMHGPFAKLIARIVKLDSYNRLKCVFNLLEGKIDMSINAKDVVLVT